MKLISWNVNGLRACAGKGFFDFFASEDADFFCLGETKMQPDQASFETPGYLQYWNSAEKKGYSRYAELLRGIAEQYRREASRNIRRARREVEE